jgi:hypothetical protein
MPNKKTSREITAEAEKRALKAIEESEERGARAPIPRKTLSGIGQSDKMPDWLRLDEGDVDSDSPPTPESGPEPESDFGSFKNPHDRNTLSYILEGLAEWGMAGDDFRRGLEGKQKGIQFDNNQLQEAIDAIPNKADRLETLIQAGRFRGNPRLEEEARQSVKKLRTQEALELENKRAEQLRVQQRHESGMLTDEVQRDSAQDAMEHRAETQRQSKLDRKLAVYARTSDSNLKIRLAEERNLSTSSTSRARAAATAQAALAKEVKSENNRLHEVMSGAEIGDFFTIEKSFSKSFPNLNYNDFRAKRDELYGDAKFTAKLAGSVDRYLKQEFGDFDDDSGDVPDVKLSSLYVGREGLLKAISFYDQLSPTEKRIVAEQVHKHNLKVQERFHSTHARVYGGGAGVSGSHLPIGKVAQVFRSREDIAKGLRRKPDGMSDGDFTKVKTAAFMASAASKKGAILSMVRERADLQKRLDILETQVTAGAPKRGKGGSESAPSRAHPSSSSSGSDLKSPVTLGTAKSVESIAHLFKPIHILKKDIASLDKNLAKFEGVLEEEYASSAVTLEGFKQAFALTNFEDIDDRLDRHNKNSKGHYDNASKLRVFDKPPRKVSPVDLSPNGQPPRHEKIDKRRKEGTGPASLKELVLGLKTPSRYGKGVFVGPDGRKTKANKVVAKAARTSFAIVSVLDIGTPLKDSKEERLRKENFLKDKIVEFEATAEQVMRDQGGSDGGIPDPRPKVDALLAQTDFASNTTWAKSALREMLEFIKLIAERDKKKSLTPSSPQNN